MPGRRRRNKEAATETPTPSPYPTATETTEEENTDMSYPTDTQTDAYNEAEQYNYETAQSPDTATETPQDTTPEETTETTETSEDTAGNGEAKQTRKNFKPEDLVMSEPEAAQDAPPVTRDRARKNPFDVLVKATFDQKFYTDDVNKWAKTHVNNVKAAKRLIRNAAQHLNETMNKDDAPNGVGVEIRDLLDNENGTEDDAGNIWFRGKPKREVKSTTASE